MRKDNKKNTNYVPEMANAYVDLSALGNLTLMGELYGVPKKQRQKIAAKY